MPDQRPDLPSRDRDPAIGRDIADLSPLERERARSGREATAGAASPPTTPEEALFEGLARRPRLTPGRLVLAALSVVLLVILLVVALPWATGAAWSQIGPALASAPLWAVPAMLLLGVLALVLEALTVRAAAPGASFPRALHAHAASSALGLAIPGGGLLGTGTMGWLLHRAGLTLTAVVTAIVLASGIETVVSAVLLPTIGLGAYAVASVGSTAGLELPGGLWTAIGAIALGAASLAALAALLNRRLLSSLLDSMVGMVATFGGKGDEDEDTTAVAPAVLAIRDDVVGLLRRRAASLLTPTLLARLVQFLAMVLALHAVGAEVPFLLMVAVFALARTLSLVPVTPGGAGITETVAAAALVSLAVPAPAAATAMLLLAVATFVTPLLAGAVALATTPPSRREAARH